MIILPRRRFIQTAALGLLSAPSIVRATTRLQLTGAGSAGASGPPVPTKIQGTLTQNGGTSSTTVVVTLPAAVSSGSLICVALGTAVTATGASVTDDKTNTYTVGNENFGSYNWFSFYASGVTNGPQVITGTFPEAHSFSTMIVTEFSNCAAVTPLDGASIQGGQTGVNTTDGITSNTATTTANGDLVWGACVNLSGNSTLTLGTGFTQDQTSGQNFNIEYLIQGTAGAIAATWTGTTSDSFSSLMMAFKHV